MLARVFREFPRDSGISDRCVGARFGSHPGRPIPWRIKGLRVFLRYERARTRVRAHRRPKFPAVETDGRRTLMSHTEGSTDAPQSAGTLPIKGSTTPW